MYDLLRGIRVLDCSTLAPSLLGMNLADLGADVIKIEAPPTGDHIRFAPPRRDDGIGFSQLRYNRGKRSVAVDLKSKDGAELFLELAAKADVVIEGLRAGTLDRLGVGFEALRKINPKIVFCSLSGTGMTGPYQRLGMHGVALDAIAGIVPVEQREDGSPYIGDHINFGSRVGALYGAFATTAALIKAIRTGQASHIDVAETDAASFAHVDSVFYLMNTGREMPKHVFKDFVRYQAYTTKDDKIVLLQPIEYKFWVNFCKAIGRSDLIAWSASSHSPSPNDLNFDPGNERLRQELAKIMRTRDRAEWVEFFIAHNVPGGPLNSIAEMIEDPHFVARENVYDHAHPTAGTLRMPTTPIKVVGQRFEARPAAQCGEHTVEVLSEILGYSDERIRQLYESGAVAGRERTR